MANNTGKTPQYHTAGTNNGSGILKITWIIILVLLAYLMLYGFINQPKDKDGNELELAEAPSFDFANWFGGVYQDKMEAHLKNNSAIGKELVPLKNQIDYDYFKKLNLTDYMIGKDNYVLGRTNIEAYYGRDFMGDSTINEKLRKVKVISDTLKAKGIDLVLLYVPNKEQIYPEVIPDAYHKYTRRPNNFDAFIKKSKQYGLNYINYLAFYQKLKPTSPYPLYPQFGSHWSYYAECLAADTLIRYIEHLKQTEMPHITWNHVDFPSDPKVRDADAINKSGLKNPPVGFPMAYPNITYTGSANARPVKTVGIGDSYYRGFLYLGVMETAFDHGEFWYYYSTIVPETNPTHEIWEYDLKSKIEENKVVLILANNTNLPTLGNGFIEDAYELYTNPAAYYAKVKVDRPFRMKKKEIHDSPELMDEATKLSKDTGVPLDTAIAIKARSL